MQTSKISENESFPLQLPSGEIRQCLVRVSLRCRRMSLHLGALRGLELVVPPACPRAKAKDFVAANSAWVEKIIRRREVELSAAKPQEDASKLPESLELKAIGQSFPIDYVDAPDLGFVSVRIETPGRLTVQGDLKDTEACKEALVLWLKNRAAKVFPTRLEEVAKACGLKFKSLSIRNQRGRWGSCSAKGGINLNFRLLLMEPRFLRHVIAHELCHTVELNHSPRFWSLLKSFEPETDIIKRDMRRASLSLPAWL